MRLAALMQTWGPQYFPWIPFFPFAKKENAVPKINGRQILVVSASIGSGHVRAAEAICESAVLHDVDATVKHVDAMNFISPLMRKIYADLYLYMVNRYPGIWGYIYRKTNRAKRNGAFNQLRSYIERTAASRLMKEVSRLRPDAIICTHFFPAEHFAYMRRSGKLICPVWVQVTDFDLHSSWVHPGVSGYFAANQEVAFLLQTHGVPAHAIHVTGIPIMPAFGQSLDRRACALSLGVDPNKKTALLAGGGEGIGQLEDIAAKLLLSEPELQLLVLAGRNVGTLKKLRDLSQHFPERLVPIGYTKEVERVMICCDFVITKPGGLTSSECLVMGLPMVLSSAIPGQEERNADFLLEHGVACKAHDARSLAYRVRELVNSPSKLESMRARAHALGKQHAALHVLNNVLL